MTDLGDDDELWEMIPEEDPIPDGVPAVRDPVEEPERIDV